MIESDFTIGFNQGQEHGKQIMKEKIKDAIAEIEQECVNDMTFDKIAKIHCIDIIKKHTEEKR